VSSGRIWAVCAACLLAIIALRLIWVFPARYLLVRPRPDRHTGRVPPWTYTFILGWAGMRGVVTLAGAYLLPPDTEHREVLLLIAFTAVAGTLFVQGLTLPWLAERLRVPPPDPVEDALARADLLHQASAAGLECLRQLGGDDPHGTQALVTARVEQRNFAAWERLGANTEDETPSEAYVRVRQQMIASERAKVLEVRDQGTVASDIVRDVLGMLDVEESMLDVTQRVRTRLRTSMGERAPGDGCPELAVTPAAKAPAPLTAGLCPGCERDGTAPVHLRMCMTCATVGCCDSSVGQHANGHYEKTGHPVMISVEPGESWRWCYVHQTLG
jgi:monovalent cation/hydrogen antiporter